MKWRLRGEGRNDARLACRRVVEGGWTKLMSAQDFTWTEYRDLVTARGRLQTCPTCASEVYPNRSLPTSTELSSPGKCPSPQIHWNLPGNLGWLRRTTSNVSYCISIDYYRANDAPD
jgi:hypothetical protein